MVTAFRNGLAVITLLLLVSGAAAQPAATCECDVLSGNFGALASEIDRGRLRYQRTPWMLALSRNPRSIRSFLAPQDIRALSATLMLFNGGSLLPSLNRRRPPPSRCCL